MVIGNSSFETSSDKGVFLETNRLFFRQWSANDFKLALDLWGDPRITKFIDARERLSEDEVRSRLASEIDCAKEFNVQYWPIFLKTTRKHVGCCGLRPYDLSHKVYEIGFHICADFWGQGFATEAARAVMDYAFNAFSVNDLFAGHSPDNTVSQHLLQKLGFRYTHDEYYAPTGLHHPSYLLSAEAYRQKTNRLMNQPL